MSDLLREFLFYLETIQGRSPKTVSGYYIELRTFFRYIKSVKVLKNVPENAEQLAEIKIDDITKELICGVTLSDIYDFLHFSMNVLGNNASSRSRKISSIRALYKYLTTKTNYLEENPAKNLDTPSMRKSVPKYLTLGESIELLASIQDESPAVTARDSCMITLMLNCGMRVSELVGINLEDIRDNTLRLLGKGNKERMVYLNDACLSAIENYLKFRKQPEGGPDKNALFLSSQHRRMTTRRVEQIVAKYLKACGLDGRGYSPHKLRHTGSDFDVSAWRRGHSRSQGDSGTRKHRHDRDLHPHFRPDDRGSRERFPTLLGKTKAFGERTADADQKTESRGTRRRRRKISF